MRFLVLAPLSLLLASVLANVEKVIFLGPEKVPILQQTPTLSDLRLPVLTPESFTIRTDLDRIFPDANNQGYSHWFLLTNLTQGQRYELRVCWSALEPTRFDMDVYELNTVWDTPKLIHSLAEYASARQWSKMTGEEQDLPSSEEDIAINPEGENGETETSVLLLQVQAAADYFTDHKDLMLNPPPVLVDLILDPFLLNVLPRSLLPTGLYIIAVVVITWFVAGFVRTQLKALSSSSSDDNATDGSKKTQ